MNDFFDSLKEIKKEMTKIQPIQEKKPQKKEVKAKTRDEIIEEKEEKMRDEFLKYIKNTGITKI